MGLLTTRCAVVVRGLKHIAFGQAKPLRLAGRGWQKIIDLTLAVA
jgi:hypothetical protein